MNRHSKALGSIARAAQDHLSQAYAAREQAFPLSRKTIHLCASAIRAAHRREHDPARVLLQEAKRNLDEIRSALKDHPDLYYSGYVQDAQKEYAEAWATLAFLSGEPLSTPQALGVEIVSYINGLAEAASELRRSILDALRRNEIEPCESWMETMDEVYSLLVTLDFPEALTGGLRHTTDQLRSVLERTRGDLTMALRQHALEFKPAEFL